MNKPMYNYSFSNVQQQNLFEAHYKIFKYSVFSLRYLPWQLAVVTPHSVIAAVLCPGSCSATKPCCAAVRTTTPAPLAAPVGNYFFFLATVSSIENTVPYHVCLFLNDLPLLLSQSMALTSFFILMPQIWVPFTSGVLRHSYFP